MVEISTSNDESLSAKRLKECKDLATRLSSFFVGVSARDKYNTVISKIVKDGIQYAFMAAQHLSFLTCAVINFASKLPKADILST